MKPVSSDPISVILVVVAIICAILAVEIKEILFSAISPAIPSVIIAIIFFRLNSAYAAAFELSVCSGLITALFVSAIALTERK